MTDITKLPDRWRTGKPVRDDERYEIQGYDAYSSEECADQLEAALPKWTEITDDPTTWPKAGVWVIIFRSQFPCTTTINHEWLERGDYVGNYWRPLIPGLDTPPQEDNDE